MNFTLKKTLLLSLISLLGAASLLRPVWASEEGLNAPTGVRPCCAFGYNLKAKVGGVPVPFFSVSNLVDADSLGEHHYNQGDNSLSASLLDLGEEHNGLIFTEKAGFIDTTHVRDTADYTYYFFVLNMAKLGQQSHLILPAELRSRQIFWQKQPQVLSVEDKVTRSAQAAALIAFQLAQWHEIAQWFGLKSVAGFDEFASAFSPEDLYSNMLGAILAKEIMQANPQFDKQQFAQALDQGFRQKLLELGAQPRSVSQQKIEDLDGVWWDSSRRLPDKWLLLKRDYHMGYELQSNYPGATHRLSLTQNFADGEPISDWVKLKVRAENSDSYFAGFLHTVDLGAEWSAEHFPLLAQFAESQDNEQLERLLLFSFNKD